MSASSSQQIQQAGKSATKPRMVHPCNFRYAGRLSNENARFLTALHEKFAFSLTNALEVYLGASLRLRLVSLEQLAMSDYLSTVSPTNYILPCAIDVMNSNCLIDIDVELVLPIIDLLLGGTGEAVKTAHELTDIDENIMETVSSLIVKELERAWKALNLTLTPSHCIKSAMIHQIIPVTEKLVSLNFEMNVGTAVTGSFTVVLPTSFVGFLLRHLKASQSKKISSFHLRRPTLQERILDCDFKLSADVPRMGIKLKDLLEMEIGTILRTNMPVGTNAKLTVDGVQIFEASAVRNGARKAAQVLSRSQETKAGKEQI